MAQNPSGRAVAAIIGLVLLVALVVLLAAVIGAGTTGIAQEEAEEPANPPWEQQAEGTPSTAPTPTQAGTTESTTTEAETSTETTAPTTTEATSTPTPTPTPEPTPEPVTLSWSFTDQNSFTADCFCANDAVTVTVTDGPVSDDMTVSIEGHGTHSWASLGGGDEVRIDAGTTGAGNPYDLNGDTITVTRADGTVVGTFTPG